VLSGSEHSLTYGCEKLFQLIHIKVAAKMSDSLYVAALNEYKSNFPRDPNLYLLMLDAYVMEKDYPKAISAVSDEQVQELGKAYPAIKPYLK
jgi:hypothetical protein